MNIYRPRTKFLDVEFGAKCNNILMDGISFVQKGKRAKEKRQKDYVREDLARVRATTMEGAFGT